MITIRIWHHQLLPYLPDLQFKGQLRELVDIMHDWRDKGKTNHVLINKVMEYPKAELTFYFALYYRRYYERYGFNIKFPIYQEFVDFGCEDIDKCSDIPLFKDWHNQTYLDICMWNLYEKHLGIGKSRITDEEWARLCEGYRQICGKDFAV